jgi:hypothetical protein
VVLNFVTATESRGAALRKRLCNRHALSRARSRSISFVTEPLLQRNLDK